MLLPRVLMLGSIAATTGFTVQPSLSGRGMPVRVADKPRQATIYMPDSEVIHDVTSDDWLAIETPDPFVGYLNGPDLRGPLAILAAAQDNIDIRTIEQIQVTAVDSSGIRLSALCVRDDMHCVNVLVSIDFPRPCDSYHEIIDALGELHTKASAILEQRRQERQAHEEHLPLAQQRLETPRPKKQMVVEDPKQVRAAERRPKKKIAKQVWKDSSLSLEEKAFAILLDLAMITITPDPSDPHYDASRDHELAPENVLKN